MQAMLLRYWLQAAITIDKVLWLQADRRCLWISTSRYSSWNSAMDYCNSQGGYLAHIYNSQDRQAILSWYSASSAKASGKRAYLGLLKAQNYDKQTDGSNIFWMTTKTQTLPFEMKNQFVGLITDIDLWGTAWSALGLNDYLTIYDDIKFSYQLFPSYYAICEQVSKRMKSVFAAFPPNSRSPAPPIQDHTVSKPRECVKLCARQSFCMGFNLKTSKTAPTVTCQLLGVTIADYGASVLADSQTEYYELSL